MHGNGMTRRAHSDDEWWPGRRGFGFTGFDAFIRYRGGIVRRADLLRAGWSADELRIAYGMWGRPERLRRGWYCVPELPEDIRRAWAAGGPLACICAVRWYAGEPVGETLHIAMHDHRHLRHKARQHSGRTPIVHWHHPEDAPDNAWAVPLELALRQVDACPAARREELARREAERRTREAERRTRAPSRG